MKIVMLIVGVLFSANAFALGANEAFDFNSGFSPIGASLGNVCYTQGMLKVIDTGSTCVKWDKEVDEDTKYDLFPRYTRTCAAWEKNGPKTVEMKKQTCLEWETVVYNDNDGEGDKYRSKCVKPGTADLPRTQRLDVYLTEIGTYLTSGQNMGSAMYTIPACDNKGGDLPDTDVPDTKK